MGGHKVDFYAEGEQWAPVGGGVVNEWVSEYLVHTFVDAIMAT